MVEGGLELMGLSSGDPTVEGPPECVVAGDTMWSEGGIKDELDFTDAFEGSGGSSGMLLSSED